MMSKAKAVALTSLVAAALVAYAPAASADSRAEQRADAAWSISHGSADASGTTRSLSSGSVLFPRTAVEGELRNTGSECYSVWIQWTADLTVSPAFKIGTQCGAGSSPVYFERSGGLGTTWVKVCRGTTTPLTDCGPIDYL
jgi:hypothetical protein